MSTSTRQSLQTPAKEVVSAEVAHVCVMCADLDLFALLAQMNDTVNPGVIGAIVTPCMHFAGPDQVPMHTLQIKS